MSNDFCGLTEEAANDRMAAWLSESGFACFVVAGTGQLVTEQRVRDSFIESRDSVALIEERLTPEQQTAYASAILDGMEAAGVGAYDHMYQGVWLLLAVDAPARCRALIQVLGLKKDIEK